ncbi:MAG: hypothetical protein C0391_08185 [Anaerolinea sp.]|nr:hypothetical protein [Anaerolinea sp.]
MDGLGHTQVSQFRRALDHTMVGAYAAFAEDKKGSLEPGKFAELITWHDNQYTVIMEDILKLTIDLTMVGGEVVHQV